MRKRIVLKKTLKIGNLTISYLEKSDTEALLYYINTLSKEKTFIMFQGEQLTFKEEDEYIKGQVAKIAKNEAVQLLAFVEDELVGVSEITMKDKVEGHVGSFGASVAKKFRDEGIGKLLMAAVLKEAKKNLTQLKIVTLEVFANNPLAISMYQKYGFIEYGMLPKGILHKDKYVDDIQMYKLI